jgi:DNA-directed RNA polymerase specialized sigma54-like protein
MTELLTKAFKKAASLPTELQDEIAQQVIDTITSEGYWDESFAQTQEQLEKLADKALAELKEGKTVEMGFDEL